MKKFAIINQHSFIDVITNSSTELFVVNNNKNLETIKNILIEMCDEWNRLALKGYFGEYYTRNTRPTIDNNNNNEKPVIIKYEDTFDDPFFYTEEMYNESGEYRWDYENKNNIGKIIIKSSTDNSIPYGIMEWIENFFSITRHHLG